MRWYRSLVLLWLFPMIFAAAAAKADVTAAGPNTRFIVLCYHNIEDSDPDQTYVGVATANFVAQLSFLKRNDYHFLTIDDLIAAQTGRRPLPQKSVLVTFDDGYESFYTRAFPILEAFHIHAVLGLVGQWMKGKPGDVVPYGNSTAARELFMSWAQVREVAASGLVEIASHSNGLHLGIPANPQGNLEPAAVTHRYNPRTGYETDDAYRRRLNADAAAMNCMIKQEVGYEPRVMIWPYGEHNGLAVDIQAAHGLPITFTLDERSDRLGELDALPRYLVDQNPSLQTFVADLQQIDTIAPVRAVQIDLDYVYDHDPAQQERNLGALVQRIHDLAINTVYLQAFADPTGSGLVRQVYFPNHELPMRADLFNRVAWQLRTRDHVNVYAWMPVLSFAFADDSHLQHVTATGERAPSLKKGERARLSPFDPEARERIRRLYADLAMSSSFSGILFHDDAWLSDYEDASPAALNAYASIGLPRSIAAIRADPNLFARWTTYKTEALIGFTQELVEVAERYRSPLHTARNIYALPVLNPDSRAWFAQDYSRFLQSYDHVAVEAMPSLEEVPSGEADNWLKKLVAAAAIHPAGLQKTVFELQSVDWRKKGPEELIPSETLAHEMRFLQRLGANSIAYYPDDFLHDHPKAAVIHPAFSLQSDPYPLP